MRIRNSAEFLEHLQVGESFYHMTSHLCIPQAIIGPCFITKLYLQQVNDNGVGMWLVDYLFTREEVISARTSFIADLTNEYHGVFTEETEALLHYCRMKYAYTHDPTLIAHQRAHRSMIYSLTQLSKSIRDESADQKKERSICDSSSIKIRPKDSQS